ncbi:MAG: hypothetical protein AAB296_09415, partial [Candidatus Desantisbacteria bacterium]
RLGIGREWESWAETDNHKGAGWVVLSPHHAPLSYFHTAILSLLHSLIFAPLSPFCIAPQFAHHSPSTQHFLLIVHHLPLTDH